MLSSLFFLHTEVSAQKERSEIDDQYKWDLTDLYESDDAWTAKKNKVAAQFDKVEEFKGKLGTSAETLLECLEFNSKLSREFMRLYVMHPKNRIWTHANPHRKR